jgi:hypothetical protein
MLLANVALKAGLNRSILETGWHLFEMFLPYKLAAAGRRAHERQPCLQPDLRVLPGCRQIQPREQGGF